MNTRVSLAAAVVLGMSATTALAAKSVAPSGLELQQIQSRDFESRYDVVFPAVMTVLQDAGYRINSADKVTGLITGTASTNSKTTYNLWWGWGKSKKTPIISAFIEPRGPEVSRVRLNFVLAKTSSIYGGFSSADEDPILEPAIYRDAFERIDKEVFIRSSMDGGQVKVPTVAVPNPTPPRSAPAPVSQVSTDAPVPVTPAKRHACPIKSPTNPSAVSC